MLFGKRKAPETPIVVFLFFPVTGGDQDRGDKKGMLCAACWMNDM